MKLTLIDAPPAGGAGGRRRRRLSSHSDSEEKKPRGRPRVEPHDENAADRRRTQIRLAQRAYRLRKETTISALKQQTVNLKAIIDTMNKTFSDFADRAAVSGLASQGVGLGRELRETRVAFAALTDQSVQITEAEAGELFLEANAKNEKSTGDSLSPEQRPSKKTRRLNSAESYPDAPLSVAPIFERPKATLTNVQSQSPVDDGFDPSCAETQALFHSPVHWSAPAGISDPEANDHGTFHSQCSYGGTHNPSSRDETILSIPPCLRLPYTFSSHESTFARRLHRATLEKAMHLIYSHRLRPEEFKKKFRLCSTDGNDNDLLQKLRSTLERSQDETLDWTDIPLRHLGGAGTHYSKRDGSEASSPGTPAAPVHSIGPSLLAIIMNNTDESHAQGGVSDLTGFEGEWYDAHDVEGYLEEKGITFEPGSNFASVESSANQVCTRRGSPSRVLQPSLDALDFFSLDQSQPHLSSVHVAASAQPHDPWHLTTPCGLFPSPGFDVAGSQAPHYHSQRRMNDSTRVVVDVQKLVTELVKRSTCLGRCPGFRRRDVDRAFNMSLAAVG